MNYPPPDGGSSDVYVYADGLAADAEKIGGAAKDASAARDSINSAWKLADGAFGSTPVTAAMDACCRTWVTGTNTIALFCDSLGNYTQNIATAYGATDTTLAAHASGMFDQGSLPQSGTDYYVRKVHGGPVA